MHADGVSEAKRYAAGDNEEEEGAPGQKHWPEVMARKVIVDPERLRRAPAHLAVERIGFVVAKNAFRAGYRSLRPLAPPKLACELRPPGPVSTGISMGR